MGFDHVEFYVGSARAWSSMLARHWGFKIVGYQGLETGHKSRVSYWLQQGKIALRITGALQPTDAVAAHVAKHGDGVANVALRVPDARVAYETAVARGAKGVTEAQRFSDENGDVQVAGISLYGDTQHLFVDRGRYEGTCMPGFEVPTHDELNPKFGGPVLPPANLWGVDHAVSNMGVGEMAPMADWYRKILGFKQIALFDANDIKTTKTALQSTVMANDTRSVMFPVNEPAPGDKTSQIQEFVDFNGGPGIQHLALLTDDLITSVKALRARGVRFLVTPDIYYDTLTKRIGPIEEDIETLRDLGILVDKDKDGYLLQIFTQPLPDRPTFFFELIQRKGAKGFGKGNFLSLFECIEREQHERNTL